MSGAAAVSRKASRAHRVEAAKNGEADVRQEVLNKKLNDATQQLASIQTDVGNVKINAGDLKKNFETFQKTMNRANYGKSWKGIFNKAVHGDPDSVKQQLWGIYKKCNEIYEQEQKDITKLDSAVKTVCGEYLPQLCQEQLEYAAQYEDAKLDIKEIAKELKPILEKEQKAQASGDLEKFAEFQAAEVDKRNELRLAISDADFLKNACLLAQGTIENYSKFAQVVEELIAKSTGEMFTLRQTLSQMGAGINMIGGAKDVLNGLNDLINAVDFGTETICSLEENVAAEVVGMDDRIKAANEKVNARKARTDQVLDKVINVLQVKQDIVLEEIMGEKEGVFAAQAGKYQKMIPKTADLPNFNDAFVGSDKIVKDMKPGGLVNKLNGWNDSAKDIADQILNGK